MSVFTNSILIASIAIAPKRQLVPPTVARPEPRIITVTGADIARFTPWAESIDGIHLIDSNAWGSELAYRVDPEMEYSVKAGILALRIQTADHFWSQGATTFFEFDVPLSYENRLDWIVYNRVTWQQRFVDFNAEFEVDAQQLKQSILRVELMILSDQKEDE